MKEYFAKDKFGLELVDTTDTHCWKCVTTVKDSTSVTRDPAPAPTGGILAPSSVITAGARTHITHYKGAFGALHKSDKQMWKSQQPKSKKLNPKLRSVKDSVCLLHTKFRAKLYNV